MIVIRNTYPVHSDAPRAEPGDVVRWEPGRQCFRLVRESDGKSLFTTAPVDRDGNRRSNGKPPVLIGVIAELKNRGWCLEIGK